MNRQSRLAVITGATSGIGRSFAFALAKQGYDVWLIGRRKELLEALAKELEAAHHVKASVIICDLGSVVSAQNTSGQKTALSEELDPRELMIRLSQASHLEVLVNNAGYSVDGAFHQIPYEDHVKQMNVHMLVATELSYIALKIMSEKKKGDIINVCSVASFIPTPFSPLYGPTKAYLKSLSETLALAYQHLGIRVQALCPGFTVTDFHTRIGLNAEDVYFKRGLLKSYTADEVVEHSFNDLKSGRVVSVPGKNYKFLVTFLRLLPFKLLYLILNQRKRMPRYAANAK